MRKFLLSSAKMEGQIELTYEEEGGVSVIDFSKARMDIVQKIWFIRNLYIGFDDLPDFVKKARFTCVEAEIVITFDMFWEKYGYKVDHKRALAVWEKLPKVKQIEAYYGIDRYFRHLRLKAEWRNKMEPKTYLKNERWEDQW